MNKNFRINTIKHRTFGIDLNFLPNFYKRFSQFSIEILVHELCKLPLYARFTIEGYAPEIGLSPGIETLFQAIY